MEPISELVTEYMERSYDAAVQAGRPEIADLLAEALSDQETSAA